MTTGINKKDVLVGCCRHQEEMCRAISRCQSENLKSQMQDAKMQSDAFSKDENSEELVAHD